MIKAKKSEREVKRLEGDIKKEQQHLRQSLRKVDMGRHRSTFAFAKRFGFRSYNEAIPSGKALVEESGRKGHHRTRIRQNTRESSDRSMFCADRSSFVCISKRDNELTITLMRYNRRRTKVVGIYCFATISRINIETKRTSSKSSISTWIDSIPISSRKCTELRLDLLRVPRVYAQCVI